MRKQGLLRVLAFSYLPNLFFRGSFRSRDPEARDELTAEVVASAYLMFVSLVERGHESLATRGAAGGLTATGFSPRTRVPTPSERVSVAVGPLDRPAGITV
jgi:hypothetical protein